MGRLLRHNLRHQKLGALHTIKCNSPRGFNSATNSTATYGQGPAPSTHCG